MLDGKRASYTRGEQLWDYLYRKDAAKAFVLAAQRGKDGRVYPVGSGMVRPLSDYIKDIRDAVNPELSQASVKLITIRDRSCICVLI